MSEVDQPLCNQVPHIVLALPYAVHAEQSGVHDLTALLLHHAGPANDIDGPRLVFDCDKYASLSLLPSVNQGRRVIPPFLERAKSRG
jgi:hypothetical protein